MGLCVTRDFFTSSHKEQPVHSQAEGPLVAPQESPSAPEKDKSKEKNGQVSSSGLLSRANPGFSSGGYNVTALATSSLVEPAPLGSRFLLFLCLCRRSPPPGLVQTIKDHITKPTAMAQGRVAHLIEWKGWRASQAGWDPTLTGEELYADLTDELKEARFAAGVAEQFAITEATLSAWSSLEEREMDYGGATQEVVQLQDLESIYLQGNVLWGSEGTGGPHVTESLPVFSPSGQESPVPNGHVWPRWGELPPSARGEQQEEESMPGSLWLWRSNTSLRYVDSSSVSEDDVFYN
nr:protein FAM131C isoform X3 [Pogona vitticeps]